MTGFYMKHITGLKWLWFWGYHLSYVAVTMMSHIAVESALVLLMLVEYVGESTLASTNGRVTHSLVLLNPCIIIPMLLVFLEFIGVTFEDDHLSKLNWFFLILMDWLLALLKGCRIFWSPLQDVISLLCQQFLSSTMLFVDLRSDDLASQ